MPRLLTLTVATCLFAATAAAQQTIGNCSILPGDNIWNTPVDTLPVLSNSTTMVNTIGASRGFHADFGAGMWDGGPIGIPFITVPGTQTKYPATGKAVTDSHLIFSSVARIRQSEFLFRNRLVRTFCLLGGTSCLAGRR